MAKLTPEEIRKESADWLQGIIALAVILSVILVGYLIFQGIKNNNIQQESKKVPVEKTT
jgi:predicted negative regulator of RcsB-dependent stress response